MKAGNMHVSVKTNILNCIRKSQNIAEIATHPGC